MLDTTIFEHIVDRSRFDSAELERVIRQINELQARGDITILATPEQRREIENTTEVDLRVRVLEFVLVNSSPNTF